MSKRFTDTSKWDDPWFGELQPEFKLMFLYLCDQCDIAGFWEINYRKASFDTGLDLSTCQGAIKGLARGLIEKSDFIWLKNFLKRQKNIPLNPSNNAHRGIIKSINDHVEFASEIENYLGASKGLGSPIGKGKGKGKGKGNTKERDSKGEEITYLRSLDTPEFREAFEEWIKYSRMNGRPLNEFSINALQKILKDHGAVKATSLITVSIANNWKSIQEPYERPEVKKEKTATEQANEMVEKTRRDKLLNEQ